MYKSEKTLRREDRGGTSTEGPCTAMSSATASRAPAGGLVVRQDIRSRRKAELHPSCESEPDSQLQRHLRLGSDHLG